MRRLIRKEAHQLLQKAHSSCSVLITEANLRGLPESVQRYLRYTQIVGKETIRTVRLKQKGFFRMQEGQSWLPMVAEQYFTTNPPAFLWYGRVQPFPFVWITGKDSFSDGHGNLRIKLLSLITLADVRGSEVDQGEFVRYLAEMAWFPTALLSDYIQWQAIDAQSVKATISYQEVTTSAILHFNQDGQLTYLTAERYWEEGGQYVLKNWSGQYSNYQEVNGICIPTKAEVSWNLESGDFCYFRGELTNIEYNLPLPY